MMDLYTENDREERLTAFIESMRVDLPADLQEIERQALRDQVPIIRPGTQGLIRVLLQMKAPSRILEVGTAVGFSALFMRESLPSPCPILTIERDEERVRQARENFARCGAEEQITLLEGDAAELLPTLEGPFDFIFMDAAKGQYIHFLPQILRLLPEGGVLLSDNILQEGDILESKYVVTRRNRTIYKRMRQYLTALTDHPQLCTTVLGTGDGAAISVKRRTEE